MSALRPHSAAPTRGGATRVPATYGDTPAVAPNRMRPISAQLSRSRASDLLSATNANEASILNSRSGPNFQTLTTAGPNNGALDARNSYAFYTNASTSINTVVQPNRWAEEGRSRASHHPLQLNSCAGLSGAGATTANGSNRKFMRPYSAVLRAREEEANLSHGGGEAKAAAGSAMSAAAPKRKRPASASAAAASRTVIGMPACVSAATAARRAASAERQKRLARARHKLAESDAQQLLSEIFSLCEELRIGNRFVVDLQNLLQQASQHYASGQSADTSSSYAYINTNTNISRGGGGNNNANEDLLLLERAKRELVSHRLVVMHVLSRIEARERVMSSFNAFIKAHTVGDGARRALSEREEIATLKRQPLSIVEEAEAESIVASAGVCTMMVHSALAEWHDSLASLEEVVRGGARGATPNPQQQHQPILRTLSTLSSARSEGTTVATQQTSASGTGMGPLSSQNSNNPPSSTINFIGSQHTYMTNNNNNNNNNNNPLAYETLQRRFLYKDVDYTRKMAADHERIRKLREVWSLSDAQRLLAVKKEREEAAFDDKDDGSKSDSLASSVNSVTRLEAIKKHMEDDASTLIQKMFRGHRARRLVKYGKIRNEAAQTIQRWYRTFLAGRRRVVVLGRIIAATRMQSAWRGYVTREAHQVFRRQDRAVRIIQKAWRSFAAHLRWRNSFSFEGLLFKATKATAVALSWLDPLGKALEAHRKKRQAIVTLQRWFRSIRGSEGERGAWERGERKLSKEFEAHVSAKHRSSYTIIQPHDDDLSVEKEIERVPRNSSSRVDQDPQRNPDAFHVVDMDDGERAAAGTYESVCSARPSTPFVRGQINVEENEEDMYRYSRDEELYHSLPESPAQSPIPTSAQHHRRMKNRRQNNNNHDDDDDVERIPRDYDQYHNNTSDFVGIIKEALMTNSDATWVNNQTTAAAAAIDWSGAGGRVHDNSFVDGGGELKKKDRCLVSASVKVRAESEHHEHGHVSPLPPYPYHCRRIVTRLVDPSGARMHSLATSPPRDQLDSLVVVRAEVPLISSSPDSTSASTGVGVAYDSLGHIRPPICDYNFWAGDREAAELIQTVGRAYVSRRACGLGLSTKVQETTERRRLAQIAANATVVQQFAYWRIATGIASSRWPRERVGAVVIQRWWRRICSADSERKESLATRARSSPSLAGPRHVARDGELDALFGSMGAHAAKVNLLRRRKRAAERISAWAKRRYDLWQEKVRAQRVIAKAWIHFKMSREYFLRKHEKKLEALKAVEEAAERERQRHEQRKLDAGLVILHHYLQYRVRSLISRIDGICDEVRARPDREENAKILQKFWRATVSRIRALKAARLRAHVLDRTLNEERLLYAAVKAQSLYRAVLARRCAADRRKRIMSDRNYAATVIQRNVRMFLAKVRADVLRLEHLSMFREYRQLMLKSEAKGWGNNKGR